MKTTDKGFLSKTTTQDRYDMQSDSAISSNIEGDKVIVNAGQDINFTAVNAISDRGTQLSAGRDVNILAAENTSSENSFSQTKKSGLFGTGGGLGFTIGKQQIDDSNTKTETQYASSKVSAIDGNVIIDAGRNYQQTGSNIVAGMGADTGADINAADRGNTVIRAQNINIDNTMDVYTNQSEQKFKQSGLTVAVSNNLVDNAKSIDRLIDAGGNTQSTRMKGMAGVATVLKTKALAKQGSDALAALQADNDFNVNGVAQNSNTRSNNKSSSAAIGGYASFGQNTSAGITASASRGKGHANSDSTTYANSQINVGSTTTFDIGNDVNIKGGIINTNRAQGQIGGDVNIESLQDTATYDSKQKNMGFSADIDIAGGGAGSSLSVNGGKTNLNSDYKAVGEQSGIFTGDGGLDLTAGGKTTLIGGAITTTEAARDAGHNRYTSADGIKTQDINNTTSYDGNAIQVGVSIGQTNNKPQASMNGLGYGSDSDSDSSVTRAGITGIAGSQDITTDNRAEYAGILENSFDAGRVNEELGAQTQITQDFGKEAPKAVAEFSQNRINAIKANPDLSIDEKLTAIAKWDEGGIYRVAAHTALGALGTGSVEGALTTGGVATAAPTLNDVQAKLAKALTDKGMNADIANGTASGVISLTLLGTGAAAGLDTSSTMTATNVDANNRQLHPEKGEYWVVELAQQIYALKKAKANNAAQSKYALGAFAEVNCATLRGDTAMRVLFGHVKGAFTGSASSREGLLKSADGGLLFLDEIGELGLDEQAMLLTALEAQRFYPLGSDTSIDVSFQLMAGTNKDLRQAVADGTFRADLFARLNTWTFFYHR